MVTRTHRAFVVPLTLAALAAKARGVSAMEEFVVYAAKPPLTVEVDRAALKADIERYIRSVNSELRATLGKALKPTFPVPEIRIADDGLARSRG